MTIRDYQVVLPDLREGYVALVNHVLHGGTRRRARGFDSYDIQDFSFIVENPRRVLPRGTTRNLKEEIGYAEALLLTGGIESASLLTSVSGTFRRFMDGGSLAGSYGPKVRPQMQTIIDTLTKDHETRQAVVMIHPGAHNVVGLRDVPCTLSLGFSIEGYELHMRATMRSNDVWLGLGYDAFQFCQLGHAVANALDLELTRYAHHAYSLHLYQRNLEAAEGLKVTDDEAWDEPTGIGRVNAPWTEIVERANSIYDGDDLSHPTDSELEYVEALGAYSRLTRTDNFAA